jgi:hypothetical protein
MGGVLGVPHCGSRGFGSEDDRGKRRGGKYRVHMYVVIDQSSPLHSLSLFSSPSVFCSILHILDI